MLKWVPQGRRGEHGALSSLTAEDLEEVAMVLVSHCLQAAEGQPLSHLSKASTGRAYVPGHVEVH